MRRHLEERAEDCGAVEHLHVTAERDDDDFVEVHPQVRPARGHDADDPKALIAQAQVLTQGVAPAKQLLLELGTNDADGTVRIGLESWEELADPHLDAAHVLPRSGRADDERLARQVRVPRRGGAE